MGWNVIFRTLLAGEQRITTSLGYPSADPPLLARWVYAGHEGVKTRTANAMKVYYKL